MKKKILFIILIFINVVFSINLIKSWLHFRQRNEMLMETQKQLVGKQEKKAGLERELAQVESRKFIEAQARKKLNMGREGELVILMPSPILENIITPTPTVKFSNIKKWIEVFR